MAPQKSIKKQRYFEKLQNLVELHPQIFVVSVDHVGSRQMAGIRRSLRNKAVVLMGKNTMIRTALRQRLGEVPQLEKLIDCVKNNIGFVFCIADASEVRSIILQNRVPAPAKQGVIAPESVTVPNGPTGMDPSQTSFFQALDIQTKIVKAQIEIKNDVNLIKKGEKITASQAVLLQKLNIRPFSYGLTFKSVYDDGSIYDPAVLDVTDDDIRDMFINGVTNLTALCLEIGIPTQPSIKHSIMQGFKHCVALVLDTDFTFPEMEAIKNILENPEAFTTIAAAAIPASAEISEKTKAAAKEEIVEPDDEDDNLGFSLFD